MNSSTEKIIKETFTLSNNGEIHFGKVVGDLLGANVESYNDYRSRGATYYLPSGETLTLDMSAPEVEIAQTFSAAAIESAILGAQRGDVAYPEFKKLSQAAGCIGYTVWLTGKHVSYFGRSGETHVEYFPQ